MLSVFHMKLFCRGEKKEIKGRRQPVRTRHRVLWNGTRSKWRWYHNKPVEVKDLSILCLPICYALWTRQWDGKNLVAFFLLLAVCDCPSCAYHRPGYRIDSVGCRTRKNHAPSRWCKRTIGRRRILSESPYHNNIHQSGCKTRFPLLSLLENARNSVRFTERRR